MAFAPLSLILHLSLLTSHGFVFGIDRGHDPDQSKVDRKNVPGGEIKHDPEIGKTAIQPEPAQTADLSISG